MRFVMCSVVLSMTFSVLGCGSMDEDAEGAIGFSALVVDPIGADRAVIRFDTSVPTSCEAEFGPAEDAMDQTATDPDMEPGQMVVEHRVALEDLAPDTVYYVRAKATDADGITERSAIVSFRTLPADADATAGRDNVALLSAGTSITAVSSNWSKGDNDSAFGIHNAFDGSMSSEWSSDYDGDDAFVALDFGQVRTLRYVGYRSRMMTDGTSIVQKVRLVAEGGPDDGAGGTGEKVYGPFATPDHTVRYVFALDPPLETQYVRFEVVESTGGNTGAREIQLFE